jgi:hypothetical protein
MWRCTYNDPLSSWRARGQLLAHSSIASVVRATCSVSTVYQHSARLLFSLFIPAAFTVCCTSQLNAFVCFMKCTRYTREKPRWLSRYSDSLPAGRFGNRILWAREVPRRPDRPWGPPSFLYNGCRVSFPGIKRPERDSDHQVLLVPGCEWVRAVPPPSGRME